MHALRYYLNALHCEVQRQMYGLISDKQILSLKRQSEAHKSGGQPHHPITWGSAKAQASEGTAGGKSQCVKAPGFGRHSWALQTRENAFQQYSPCTTNDQGTGSS